MSEFQWSRLKFHLPRVILGAVFVFSGLNGFFGLFPDPAYSESGQSFIAQLKASNVWWVLLKSIELIGGTLLLSGSAGRFGVLVLAPITAGIFLFHLFLSPQGAWLGYTVFALEVFLLFAWRKNLVRLVYHPHHEVSPRLKAHVT